MKKITLAVGGKQYTISLDEPYAEAMEKEIKETFVMGQDNDVKVLLQAYLAKQLAYFETVNEVKRLLDKLPD
ncbi:MAG: hypothetical protein GXO33_02995 [Epsilonproteobacteria bacterium]|nr:hypothetical protein [Campylobacterota bacterium]